MDKEKITENITIPNKNLEILKKHFSHCFDKNGNFDFEKFKKELSKNEINFSKESYGMDWLGKSYARLLASDEATTLLKENEEFNQKEANKNSQNLLIKGDNLEVLKHLSNAYYEEVKMIYIDPPYNTGGDGFVYQDDRKFTVSEFKKLAGVNEEKAKRVLDFVDSKSNSHSAWLTFMYPRLYIAKQLLKDDGVIFVSIDDNEVAQLRLLMDEVFGEENFVGVFLWKKNKSGNQNAKYMSVQHDYIIAYVKIKDMEKWRLPYSKEDLKDYKEKDDKGLFYFKPVKHSTRGKDLNLYYNDNKYFIEKSVYNKESLLKMLNDNEAVFRKNSKKQTQLYMKQRLKSGILPYSFLEASKFPMTENGVEEVFTLFNKDVFNNPKPTKLIKYLIQIGSNPKELILDFFAGSGTTGDAVMQLNAKDGGKRKYILVQLPEVIDKKKNRTAYDFVKDELGVENPTIFEITKERLIRASKKIEKEILKTKITKKEKEIKDLEVQLIIDNKDEKIKQLKTEIKALKNQDLGFKIFETTPIWEDYNLEAEEFDPHIKLFDETKLKDDDLKILLTTWKTYDGIVLTQDLNEIDLDGYKGYYFEKKIYLLNKGFVTKNLKKLLEEIDKNKDFTPAIIIAFGYNFESKVLREIAENIKSYANKKHIDIDFITRY